MITSTHTASYTNGIIVEFSTKTTNAI